MWLPVGKNAARRQGDGAQGGCGAGRRASGRNNGGTGRQAGGRLVCSDWWSEEAGVERDGTHREGCVCGGYDFCLLWLHMFGGQREGARCL